MELPFLRDPIHHESLQLEGREFTSTRGDRYPLVGGIPWMFPDAGRVLKDWRERASLSLQHFETEIAELKTAMKTAPAPTRERLEKLRTLKIQHLELLKRVLDPLKPNSKQNFAQIEAYGYRLPLRQGLLGYFPNLIRDWSGRYESENAALLHSTLELLKLKSADSRILMLGAGGSRLAYDLALKYPKAQIVAFDLNPILLLGAQQICEGLTLKAASFPVSPKDSGQPGQIVELRAPNGGAKNLHFVFGDVYALPFTEASFDICVTPWLIDILPRRFADLCNSVARVVKPEGAWVNSGSWHFSFRDEVDNISFDEAKVVAANNGWSPVAHSQTEVPYLQSPDDAHRRFETTTQFLWERTQQKVSTVPLIDDRADWIRDPNIVVPPLPAFAHATQVHAVMALVLSLVDGKRTLQDIATAVAAENGLTSDQALDAAQSFFDRFLKDRHFREAP